MKRIGICTLHDANPNFGATLQAFAMQEKLRELGYEPEFLKFKHSIQKAKLKYKLKVGKQFEHSKFTPKDIRKIVINKGIIKSSKYLNISKKIYRKDDKYDSIVIGSDELWNLNNPSFKHFKEYYGYNLNCENIIAYAPSSNGTDKETFENYYKKTVSLENIKILSARDKITQKFIKDVSGKEATLVVDPTILIDDFNEYAIEPQESGEYILVYDYRVSEENKKKIKEFAKEKKLRIYSIGFYNGWADKNIDANIFEFLGYVKNAKYVVTATFHGTIFSILFKKQFVTTAGDCKKIIDILERLELTARDITHIDKIDTIIDEKIDYEKVEKIKNRNKEISIEYLKKALNGEKI